MKTITKLANATKFSFLNLEDYDFAKTRRFRNLDRWFLTKLNKVIREATDSFENYEYSKAKMAVERFFGRVIVILIWNW
jgi:valyl-tRNA synthetase